VLPTLPALQQSLQQVELPSTSPAHASLPIAAKLMRWREALVPSLAERTAPRDPA
jgi:hypothetical protein